MSELANEPALLFAFEIRDLEASEISWKEVRARAPATERSYTIIGLNRNQEEARDWLRKESGLPRLAIEGLLAEETRPRAQRFEGGMVINLRGVNLNPGAEPEDMVSLRIWLDAHRLISVQLRRLKAYRDTRDLLKKKETTPETAGAFFSALASRLADRMEPVIQEDSETIDTLEEESIEGPVKNMRLRLGDLRRDAVILRRYIAPQKDLLNGLSIDQTAPFDERTRLELRETADRVTRLVEELDAVRDRASVLTDQLVDKRAEEMNRNMMILSVVAAIFLPLGFLTGLLGINVGGMPGAGDPRAFWVVVALCFLLGGGLLFYFDRKGWL